MSLKYIAVPGYVISLNDGDRHYVGFERLCDLYGVKSRDAIRFDPVIHNRKEFLSRYPNAQWLFPDPSGEYKT